MIPKIGRRYRKSNGYIGQISDITDSVYYDEVGYKPSMRDKRVKSVELYPNSTSNGYWKYLFGQEAEE